MTVDSSWWNNIRIHRYYWEYWEAFVERLERFHVMPDEHLGPKNNAAHHSEVTSPRIWEVILTLYPEVNQKHKNPMRRRSVECWKKKWLSLCEEMMFTCRTCSHHGWDIRMFRSVKETKLCYRQRLSSLTNNGFVYRLISGCSSIFDPR